ncbi:unnamed protein product [Closterium sp. NIES-64]|nr:unnamed protein product [Closterium sp. NIES-64]
MHEYQMQNAAARRAEASNHSKKGIGGTVLFLMLLVCTAAVGWGGYQYKQALSLELRLSELQRKHTRLASKLSDDVPASVSRIFPSSSSSSSSSRCEVEGEDGAVEGTCSPFPTERSEGDSAGWREGSGSEEESDRERRSSKEKAKEKSKEKKEEEEEEEEVKEDQELFWRRVALLASILCLVLPIFIIRNIDEVAQLFGRRPKATDGHTTAAASSSSSSSTSAAAAAAAAAGAAPSAAPGADEEVSMSKRLAYKVDVLFSMHSWVKGAALLAATLLLLRSSTTPPPLYPCAAGADEEVSMSKRLAYKVDVLFSMHSFVLGQRRCSRRHSPVKEEVSMSKRLAYKADVLFSMHSFVLGLALYAVGSKDRMDLGDATWRAWSYVADAGNHADSEGVGPRIVGVSISIGGMLIFALMVGLVSEGISEKVDSLKKGKSDVIEKNHTLILGWSDKLVGRIAAEATGSGEREHGRGRGVVEMMIPPLGLCIAAEATGSGEREHGRGRGVVEMMIPPLGLCIAAEATGSGEREHGRLAVANESMGGGVVVVMSEREKEEMESEIQKMEFNFRGTTVICREREEEMESEIQKMELNFRGTTVICRYVECWVVRHVSVSTARALIVLAEAENADAADARALRVVLSLMGVREGLRLTQFFLLIVGFRLPFSFPSPHALPPPHAAAAPARPWCWLISRSSGSPLVLADLKKVSVSTARALIVLAEAENADAADARALRVVLSLTGVREGLRGHIVVELSDIDNQQLVKMVGGRMVETVVAHDVIGRLMIQCARQPGLAQIWETLLGFENCEFYTKHWPELVGKTFREVLLSFPDAVPCGLRVSARTYYEKSTEAVGFEFAGGSSVGSEDEEEEGEEGEGGGEGEGKRVHKEHTRLWLNPDDDYVLQPEDSVLVIAEDDDSYAPGPLPVVQDAPLPDIETPPKLPEKILFCGWRRDIDDMITVLEAFLARGSELWIFSDVPVEEREARLIEGGLNPSELENVMLVHRMGNAVIRRHLEFLPLETFDSILILADEGLEDSIINCDSRSLATLLLIRDIQSKRMPAGSKGHRRSNSSITYPRPTSTSSWVGQMQQASQQSIVISEILDSRTRSLVSVSKISDYVLSNELVSMALAMVAEDREVNRVLEELFSEEGNEMYIRPAEHLPDGRGGAVLLPSAPIYTPLHPSAPIRATPSTATRCTLGLRMEIIIGYRLPHQPPVHSFPPLCTPLHPSAPIQGNKIYIHPAELYLADGEELSFFEMAGNEMYIRPAELYLTDGEELSFFEVAVRARQHMEIIISSATGSSLSSLCTPLHPSIPLLSSFQGNEMYIRPAELYLTDGEELSFFEVAVRARQRMEIIIGYRLFTEDEAVLNPPDKAERRTWSIQDTFIVLSFNE